MTEAVERLDDFLRRGLGIAGPVALHEPAFDGNEWSYVKQCIDTGWVSSAGEFVDRFETELARACGVANAIAMVNGTAALHITLKVLGVGPGDAVVCPALTFVATANAIAHCGAVPVFADSDPSTLGLDPDALEAFLDRDCEMRGGSPVHRDTGLTIAAIVPVHVFGHPVDMDRLNEAARRYGVPVIEDATEALGSRYRGRPAGGLGTAGVLSFNGNKILTTGGGGAVLTDDAQLARRIRHLSTTARIADAGRHSHDEVGYNYRMPNLNAALGCAQLEQLGDFVERKRRLQLLYDELFEGCADVAVFAERPWAESNYWLNALMLPDAGHRDRFLAAAGERGIATRACWRLMCDLPMYRTAPRAGDLGGARGIEARLVSLPSGPGLLAGEHDRPDPAASIGPAAG